MGKKSFAMAAILMLVVWAAAAHADLVIYDFPATVGSQAFTGSLGMDFDVNSAITITAVGVFNSGQAGINGTLSAEIFNVTTGLPVAGTLVSLTGTQGTLIDGSRFLSITPVSLPVGDYSIVSWGYSSTDLDGNYTDPPPATILNDYGGAISFVGSGRYSLTADTFPTIIDGGAADQFYAGTFEVDPPPVVPLPASVLLLGTGLLAMVGLGWRQRRPWQA